MSLKKTLTCRLLKPSVALAALAVSGICASPAAANWNSPRYGTCLHRSSDGFDGCWLDGQSPSTNSLWNAGFNTQMCHRYYVTFESNSPAWAHGVPRTHAIATQLAHQLHPEWGSMSAWVGLGGTVQQSSDFGLTKLRVFLGRQNSYARVRVQAYGNSGLCYWG